MSDLIERETVVEALRFLAEARRGYFQAPEPKTSLDIDQMDASQLMIWTQIKTAEQLANIFEGGDDAKGWLPSWRWDEWHPYTRVLTPGQEPS